MTADELSCVYVAPDEAAVRRIGVAAALGVVATVGVRVGATASSADDDTPEPPPQAASASRKMSHGLSGQRERTGSLTADRARSFAGMRDRDGESAPDTVARLRRGAPGR